MERQRGNFCENHLRAFGLKGRILCKSERVTAVILFPIVRCGWSGRRNTARRVVPQRFDLCLGLLIIAVVILHNVLGYGVGYGIGKVLKLDTTKCRAISIEVGMQNSGLATSLAATHFAQYPLATIPGAVFSVWHNVSGAILANFFARTAEKKA